MPRILRLRSFSSTILALPSLPRCDRPSAASASTSGVQPGRLAQGPEQKLAALGRIEGLDGISGLSRGSKRGGSVARSRAPVNEARSQGSVGRLLDFVVEALHMLAQLGHVVVQLLH